VRIDLLADHPQCIDAIARWHCEEEGTAADAECLGFWRGQLRNESGRHHIPIAFVAFVGDQPVGAVALVERNMNSHPDLSPWLAGTFVHRSHRGRGIGSTLVAHAVEVASNIGVRRLYAYTEAARSLYEKRGFRPLWTEDYEGERVHVLAIELRAI
jgi:GNAT superfamily N-acetyltransferase